MKKICLLSILFFVGTAHAAQFVKVLKPRSVVAYKDPSKMAKILNVFKEGELVQIVNEKDGWFKVKVPFSQGSFVYGWIFKSSPNITIVTDGGPAAVQKGGKSSNKVVPQKRVAPKTSHQTSDEDIGDSDNKYYVRAFGGPVFNLHKYGTTQTKVGLSLEIPVEQNFRLGIPLSYSTGGSFHTILVGLEGIYSFYVGPISVSPRVSGGFEYLYGNGKSFNALTGELGPMFEYSISSHITLGLEPFTLEAMLWNSTESINKVPFNVRLQSLILVKGRW